MILSQTNKSPSPFGLLFLVWVTCVALTLVNLPSSSSYKICKSLRIRKEWYALICIQLRVNSRGSFWGQRLMSFRIGVALGVLAKNVDPEHVCLVA